MIKGLVLEYGFFLENLFDILLVQSMDVLINIMVHGTLHETRNDYADKFTFVRLHSI